MRKTIVSALLLAICIVFATACVASAQPAGAVPRPSTNGELHLEGANLVDKQGDVVALKGVSTHGLTWYPQYVNQELFNEVSDEWGANLIRLAAYSSEFTNGNKKKSMTLVEQGIEYAIAADLYVLVDWHILSDCDPNTNIDEAITFFNYFSKKYADCPNVIYEICNEPNGATTWADVKDYAQCIIPLIKAHDPNAVIVVGTPNYDRDLPSATSDPILGYSNIMYTFHFYAASHKEDMRAVLQTALDGGLPVFITECGMSEDSGDGDVDYESASQWFQLLQEYNLPYAIWSLSNKDESSAMIKSHIHHSGHFDDNELTAYGRVVKSLLQTDAVNVATAEDTGFDLDDFLDGCRRHMPIIWVSLLAVMTLICLLVLLLKKLPKSSRRKRTYNDYIDPEPEPTDRKLCHARKAGKVFLFISSVCSLAYLVWRMAFSIPFSYGWVAVAFNILLLIVEIVGFIESSIHYSSMIHLRDYPLPQIADEEFPHVDVYVSTYNEPEELLRKTLQGCKHMKYPELGKVHIYLCDDNRRPSMRALAEELGVNYLDRPDNQGAKAGNLNHAMSTSSSPYIVTFDADMIPKDDFLLKTIPYYVDAEKRDIPLGLIQTPQCFHTEDVFQHNLYAEANIPNEQDFFYRTIEPAKTSTNSVIYGGSNTILSRKALNSIGGFYTESITEDFATGMLIEAKGYVSLGLHEPLASGLAPSSFQEHIQQRTRWGRGVILTAKKLKFMSNPNLTLAQKMSYLSSVVYWFTPVFNAVYLLMPLLFALFSLPVFNCTVPELLMFWAPMFAAQNICLRLISSHSMSVKWSGIQEMSVTPFLLIPILKESLGFSLSVFKVTDKSKKSTGNNRSWKLYAPFAVLLAVYLYGIVRVALMTAIVQNLGLVILLFWLVRNLFFIVMCLFLVDGRPSDGEEVKVLDSLEICVRGTSGEPHAGITTQLTEHNIKAQVSDEGTLRLGEQLQMTLAFDWGQLALQGAVVEVVRSSDPEVLPTYTIEIMDFKDRKDDYIYALYNRVPTLPQTLTKDLGIIRILTRNIAKHLHG